VYVGFTGIESTEQGACSVLYDISPPISPKLKVWPGDTSPSRQVLMHMAEGANITLSTLHTTVHVGAHADAPSHYSKSGASIDQRSLHTYIGKCQVIRVPCPPRHLVSIRDLDTRVHAKRVLICTGTYPNPNEFNEDFAALSPDLVDRLHEQGVFLVGVDMPSVDPFESKELKAHKKFLLHDMAILEGLVLGHVPEGVYELIALPLNLVGFDASPVRAVLRLL